MYLPNQDLVWRNKTPITVVCDTCNKEFSLLYKSAEKNRKKNNKHLCCDCVGFKLRPQNQQQYWTDEKKVSQSISIVNSETYKIAIENRDTAGTANGMFGKKFSDETKQKMSKSRTGKIGEKATAWKGGKCSLNVRLKGLLHGRYNWYYRVYQRDYWKCQECQSTKKIDAHHIKPISKIIRELLSQTNFQNDDEKLIWLIEQPEIVDPDLKNGITLCRPCHKKRHQKWGSHNAES